MPKEVVTDFSYPFQDWLHEMGIIDRRDPDSGDPLGLQEGLNWTKTEFLLIQTLADHYGYIRPRSKIIEDLEQKGRIGCSYEMVSVNFSRIRNKLQTREDLISARGVGYGIGISRFELTATEILLLQRFQAHFGKWLSTDDLIQDVWGDINDQGLFNFLPTNIYRLRLGALANSSLIIQNFESGRGNGKRGKGFYRLVEVDRSVPSYYGKIHQEGLQAL